MTEPVQKAPETRTPPVATPRSCVASGSNHAVQLKASLRGHDYATQVQMLSPDGAFGGDVHAVAAKGVSGSGGALHQKEKIQQSFGGYDISNVQAHTDSSAAAMGVVQRQECNPSMMSEPEADSSSIEPISCEAPDATHQTQIGITGTTAVGSGGAATAAHVGSAQTVGTQDAEENANAGPAGAPVTLPSDFSQEGVLKAWIGELNSALAKRVAKGRAGARQLKKLQDRQWADASGLNYELLVAAANNSENGGQPADSGANAPSGTTSAKVLKMLAKGNALLYNIITPDFQGKCMQFSEKLMADIGAKRTDGTTSEKRGLETTKGPLTAIHRGKHIKELPTTLPPGYQICVVSRPDWGFTEVGNHWFISAGDGYYLDNTMGVLTGSKMTASLVNATADQWANRLFDLDKNALRTQMAAKFQAVKPEFAQYLDRGRTDKQKKGTAETNAEYVAASSLEIAGRAAIKNFVKTNDAFHPKVWLVEPTEKA